MSTNTETTDPAFHDHLGKLIKTTSEIATHQEADGNDLNDIIDIIVTRNICKSFNPALKTLKSTLSKSYVSLMENKSSCPDTYNLIKGQIQEIKEKIEHIDLRTTGIQNKLNSAESELDELKTHYVTEINNGNEDEQQNIEERTQTLISRIPTLKMMLDGNKKAINIHRSNLALLNRIQERERAKVVYELAQPYYDEFDIALDEFTKAFHKLCGIESQHKSIPPISRKSIGDFTRLSSKDHNYESIIELLKQRMHPSNSCLDKSPETRKHSDEFAKEIELALSTPVFDLVFNPKPNPDTK